MAITSYFKGWSDALLLLFIFVYKLLKSTIYELFEFEVKTIKTFKGRINPWPNDPGFNMGQLTPRRI